MNPKFFIADFFIRFQPSTRHNDSIRLIVRDIVIHKPVVEVRAPTTLCHAQGTTTPSGELDNLILAKNPHKTWIQMSRKTVSIQDKSFGGSGWILARLSRRTLRQVTVILQEGCIGLVYLKKTRMDSPLRFHLSRQFVLHLHTVTGCRPTVDTAITTAEASDNLHSNLFGTMFPRRNGVSIYLQVT
ncbi:hypothetical protein COMA2_210021 [Candidatus Nitrospira nitrificans]|uniref:Uncharacterized protein n=1 Tax=Candidatus Nitrospira nitrificans TaxID=1742973 RepID=A0A0S4LF41_9BACT|nr:hypothetical protein COMA2_210021 [Candidatus Nitrospira nitrificans]